MHDNNWNQPLVIQPKPDTRFTHAESMAENKKSNPKKKIFIAILIIIGLAILAYVAFLTFAQYKILPKNTLTTAQVTSAVNKLVLLPSDEIPDIRTITDLPSLSTQPFFNRAAQNDQLLIFKVAKKAILYRPSTNQIIEMANLQ